MAQQTSIFPQDGDVTGPASATDGAIAVFDGTTGKVIKVGAGGGGYVSSITGTANQITASAATGDVTLSIPSTFIAPGSIAATTTVSGTIGTFTTRLVTPAWVPAAGTAAVTGALTTNTSITVAGQLLSDGVDTWIAATGEFRSTGRGRFGYSADGVMLFRNAGATAGYSINGTVDGTATFLSRAGADTAIVKASKFTPSTQQTYTITNVTTDRSYDANATTLDEIADTLGTLVADLRAIGLVL